MYSDITNIAVEAALEAGKLLKKGFGTNFVIKNKAGINNLVTEYDHKSENIIINIIKSKFPDHAFLAEESGASDVVTINNTDTRSQAPALECIRWIIDPLDGTVNFAHNIPIFSVSIAAESNNEILCGVVFNPMLDELFTAEKGKGAKLNGNEIKVSENNDFRKSVLVTGFPYNVIDNPYNTIDHFVKIIKKGIPVRRLGSAALDLAYVAAGRFDGFWEVNLHPWDVAAGVLLTQEAGGKISKFDNSLYSIYDKTILTSNGLIHEDMVKIFSNEE